MIHISGEVKDYVKQLLNLIGESEEKYKEMMDDPELYRDEWNDISIAIREMGDEYDHLADEIEEMLSES